MMQEMIKLSDMQMVVLMGGLGTRLGELTGRVPKPLVEVCGQPFFDYQMKLLSTWGFKKFLLLVGYHGEMVEEHYGDGSKYGVSIRYIYDGEKRLGTGGAVRNALPQLEKQFFLIYGDSYMDIDYEECRYRFFEGLKHGRTALMTVYENSEGLEKGNVIFHDQQIELYDKKMHCAEMNYVDYGVQIFSRSEFEDIPQGKVFDIAELQKKLSVEKKLTGCEVTNRFYEIGTPQALSEFAEFAQERLLREQPVLFLDRDGVINQIVFNENTEQLDSPLRIEEFTLIDGVSSALKKLQDNGYELIIVTNQPAAAKGKCSLLKLYEINLHCKKVLKEKGIAIKAVMMCPHYPKQVRHIEDTFLICDCSCRKPRSGLLERAMELYLTDREHSYMIGDSYTDIQAGQKAGLKTVFVGSFKCDLCALLERNKPDYIVSSLEAFAEILEEK